MANVKNPNVPAKNRQRARAAKARKQTQQRAAQAGKDKVAKADERRGARAGLLPNSGPNKAVSAKKRRKLEKKLGYAVKRRMEADGEVEMKDAAAPAAPGTGSVVEKGVGTAAAADEAMAIDDAEGEIS
ncbi:hypothetical protein GGR56DRAFT_125770 [Xylariaceae sp. FL0804]|nr:hypothetical protein GGR56DRAFT_125770 [Xylariaceae sp. FL0804]